MPADPQPILDQIEEVLVADIPAAVRAAAVGERVYCLRVWYNGIDSDDTAVPWLMLVKETARRRFLADHGEQAVYYVWGADEATSFEKSFYVQLPNPRLAELYRRWHDHLSFDDEAGSLRPFREMMQAVCRRLNRLDWEALAPVTDDFVVFPADGAHLFMNDPAELAASITTDQRDRLEARGLLPAVGPDPD